MNLEKFKANLPSKDVKLVKFQDATGLREGKHRPKTFDIFIDKKYNAHELAKLANYLYHLSQAMEPVKLN